MYAPFIIQNCPILILLLLLLLTAVFQRFPSDKDSLWQTLQG